MLGEEIAADVNTIEGKLKDMQAEITQFKDITKRAMLVLERKFDKAVGKERSSKSKSRKASGRRSRSNKNTNENQNIELTESLNQTKILETLS